MTGNTPILPQVLGASTVAGTAATILPAAGANGIFSAILIGVIIVAMAVIVSRCVKILANR